MSMILDLLKRIVGPKDEEPREFLRERVRELERENYVLRDKLGRRGPWLF